MLCHNCNVWPLFETDFFCAWCGQKLVDISLTINPDYLYAGDPLTEVTLTLTHTGPFKVVKFNNVTSNRPWLIVEDKQARNFAGSSLHSGDSVQLLMKADAMDLPNDYEEATVAIDSSIGIIEARFQVSPRPKFKTSTGGEHIVLLDNVLEERMSGYLSVTRGIIAIEELSMDEPWATVEISQPATLPCKLDQRGDNRLEFLFKVDEDYLLKDARRESKELPVEYKCSLLVKLRSFDELRKEPFRVNCFLPPLLEIPEAVGTVKVQVFAGKRGELDLTLLNGEGQGESGRANLQIYDIKIDAPWLRLSGAVNYPLTIASGDYQALTLTISTDEMNNGVQPARIVFLTNIPGTEKERKVDVDVEVRQMPEFDGELSIDFGTTNSCCAYLDADKLDLIPISEDSEGQLTTISSTILYQDVFNGSTKQYIVGNRAYAVSFDPATSLSAVRQVKRYLGTDKIYDIRFQLDPSKHSSFKAREVTADIIRRILERAEEYLKGRIRSCTISHPSRFRVRQIDDLREALVTAGVTKVKTVHEPIGAALNFIRQREIRTKYEEYYLMVFDFGGGTTDISLLRVNNEYDTTRRRTVISPEVLGATADREFGGEDVTDIVMRLVKDRCETELRARYPDARNTILPFDAENFREAYRRRLAQENRNVLRQWSESVKIAISNKGDNHDELIGIDLQRSFQLAVIVDSEIRRTESFDHDVVVPKQHEIDEALRPKLESIAQMMQQLAQPHIAAPHIILLSGKSSALPVVRKVMEQYFPDARLEVPTDLKECVVRGACELSNPDPAAGVSFNLKNAGALSATTSWLGLRVTDDETGEPRFEKVIDAGMPIGTEGLKRPVPSYVELRRDSKITILENTGLETWMRRGGQRNKNITPLKAFRLEAKLEEWEQRNGRRIGDRDLADAEMELVIMPDLIVKLIARIRGVGEALEFETELAGG